MACAACTLLASPRQFGGRRFPARRPTMSSKSVTVSRSVFALVVVLTLAVVGGVAPTFPAAAEAPSAADSDVERALLELRVRTALLEKIGVPAADVSVKATLGEIWLLGTVKNDSASETAQDVAES